MNFNKLFKWRYDPAGQMAKKFPKAARKKRIRNKWRNRFGVSMAEIYKQQMMFGEGFFKTEWKDEAVGIYPIPIKAVYVDGLV
jgi:hypothetical protein